MVPVVAGVQPHLQGALNESRGREVELLARDVFQDRHHRLNPGPGAEGALDARDTDGIREGSRGARPSDLGRPTDRDVRGRATAPVGNEDGERVGQGRRGRADLVVASRDREPIDDGPGRCRAALAGRAEEREDQRCRANSRMQG